MKCPQLIGSSYKVIIFHLMPFNYTALLLLSQPLYFSLTFNHIILILQLEPVMQCKYMTLLIPLYFKAKKCHIKIYLLFS